MSREDRLLEVLLRTTGPLPYGLLTPTATFADDLEMDFDDIVEFVCGIEDEFDCHVDDDIADKWKTYGHALSYVNSLPSNLFEEAECKLAKME